MGNSEGNYAAKPMPIPFEKVSAVMDKETYDWHSTKHYAGYVAKRNEIEKELDYRRQGEGERQLQRLQGPQAGGDLERERA